MPMPLLLLSLAMSFGQPGAPASRPGDEHAALRRTALEGRAVPVAVTLAPAAPAFDPGGPILLEVGIYNGLETPIDFIGFGTEMTEWNAETASVSLVNIRRGESILNRFLARPEVRPPRLVAGHSRRVIEPGEALVITIDARKWAIRDGGWIPGRYEVDVRVAGLRLDRATTADIMSEPAAFEVR